MKLFSEYRGLRRELYVLFIGRVMTNMGGMIWPMFTLIMNRKLGMDASAIALWMLAFSILFLPVNLLGGKLADRMNKKNIIVVCDFVSILSYIYCFLVPLTIGSVIVFLLAALFQSIEGPSYEALIADFTTSRDRERAYSLGYLGANLGLMLAPTLGGILFENHLNLAFLINGICIAVSTLLIALLIKDVHREEDDAPESVYEAEIDRSEPVMRYIRGHRVIALYILAEALAGLVYSMFNYLMPLDLSAVYGGDGSVLFGTMTSVNCVLVVIFTSIITRWFRRVGDVGKMFTGSSLILAGYALFMAFIRSRVLCYAAISVFTFGEIFHTLASEPFLTRRIPASHRGRILSVMSVFSSLFSSLMQVAVGRLYDRSGSVITWGLVLLAGAVQLGMLCIMNRMDRADYAGLHEKRH